MNLSSRTRGLIALVLLALILIAIYWFSTRSATAPMTSVTASSTPLAAATTTAPATTITSHTTSVNPLPVDSADHIASWSLGSPSVAATAKATSDMAMLRAELGKGTYSNYDMYVGIGQDYELLGDGQNAYNSFVSAEETDTTRALAYEDIGNLMAQLGALTTAHEAYIKATATEPAVEAYQRAYLQFLTTYTPSDTATVSAAFLVALKKYPSDSAILTLEAEWYGATGQTASAIATWQMVLPLVPAAQQAAIQAEISQLKG